MKNTNGDKYINHKVFWPIITAVFIVIGIVGSFLLNRINKQEDKTDKVEVDVSIANIKIATIETHVTWIRELFEGKLQGVVDERVERMVQKQFEIALDPRMATPADRKELASTTEPTAP